MTTVEPRPHLPSDPCASSLAVPAPARFNERATAYGCHAQVQDDMAAWLAQWLPQAAATAQPTAAQVLELGAGDGMFTRHLLPRFARVTAMDAAVAMLEQGKKNCPQAQWQLGDAWTLAPLVVEAGRYDWLVSSSLLQWCPQPEQVLLQWARCCQPGTRLLHGFYVAPTLQEWRSVFGADGSIAWRSEAAWLAAFAAAGWRVLRSEVSVRNYSFSNALELARSLHRTGVTPSRARIGSGRFRALLRAYDARFKLPPVATATAPATALPAATAGAGETGATTGDTGVGATWAFFRIEAQRS